jgi:hypothetical protein
MGEYHEPYPAGNSCVVVINPVAFFRLERSLHSGLPEGLGRKTVIKRE